MELDLARSIYSSSIAALGPSAGLSLVVGRAGDCPTSLLAQLGSVRLDGDLLARAEVSGEKLPAEWEADRFEKRPEIAWTFRTGEKQVPFIISAIYTAIFAIGAPWLVLIFLVRS